MTYRYFLDGLGHPERAQIHEAGCHASRHRHRTLLHGQGYHLEEFWRDQKWIKALLNDPEFAYLKTTTAGRI